MSGLPVYSIYAIQYAGPLRRYGAHVLKSLPWDLPIDIGWFFWVIRGPGATLVVDCGVPPRAALDLKLNGYVDPVEKLRRIGIEADQVDRVIISHIHDDHVGGIRAFPNAQFFVQRQEFEFWIKDPMAQKPMFRGLIDSDANGYLGSLEGTQRLQLIDGDQTIFPGIELLFAPGHTVGLQVVAANTARGTAILGSDCAHLFESYTQDVTSNLITDLVAWMRTYEKLRARASSPDLLFPGHDLRMTTDYPRIAEGVTRLV
jgi:glyoxylase-like metal-dependent hydrolase (beta-lactamase superfamily II)